MGGEAVAHYPGMVYWDYNWRKQGGSSRMIEISKREKFYQQEYCGCVYSLRDTNLHRKSQGRPLIKIVPAPLRKRREGVILWITFLIDFILAR